MFVHSYHGFTRYGWDKFGISAAAALRSCPLLIQVFIKNGYTRLPIFLRKHRKLNRLIHSGGEAIRSAWTRLDKEAGAKLRAERVAPQAPVQERRRSCGRLRSGADLHASTCAISARP
jgi:hypothetical protein